MLHSVAVNVGMLDITNIIYVHAYLECVTTLFYNILPLIVLHALHPRLVLVSVATYVGHGPAFAYMANGPLASCNST